MSKEINLEEIFRKIVAASKDSAKSAFVLNGAAAVALLAFLAHLVAAGHKSVSLFAYCLLPFGLGASLAAMSFFSMYFAYAFGLFGSIEGNEEAVQRCLRSSTRAGMLMLGSHLCYIAGLLVAFTIFRFYIQTLS